MELFWKLQFHWKVIMYNIRLIKSQYFFVLWKLYIFVCTFQNTLSIKTVFMLEYDIIPVQTPPLIDKGGYFRGSWDTGSLRVLLPFTKQTYSPNHLSLALLNQSNFSSLISHLQFVSFLWFLSASEQSKFPVLTITLHPATLLCAGTPKLPLGFWWDSHSSFLVH